MSQWLFKFVFVCDAASCAKHSSLLGVLACWQQASSLCWGFMAFKSVIVYANYTVLIASRMPNMALLLEQVLSDFQVGTLLSVLCQLGNLT
jgi:hypothetical protein